MSETTLVNPADETLKRMMQQEPDEDPTDQ